MTNLDKIAVHDFPAWRENADFIIACHLGEELGINDLLTWEQLWARKVNDSSFELCCVPFFAYGLALGDIVLTVPLETRTYVVSSVAVHSGRRTFRVIFQDLDFWKEVIDEITSLGCIVEVRWERCQLVAVDAASDIEADLLIAYLTVLEGKGVIHWENGN